MIVLNVLPGCVRLKFKLVVFQMDFFQKFGLVFLLKAILQLVLLILFLYFFGIPSVRTYQKKETIVLKYEIDTNGIEAPAVTIQATQNTSGWKSLGGKVYWKSFEVFQHCARVNLTVEECIEEDSITLSDFLEDVRFGEDLNASSSVLNSLFWKEDMSVTAWGRHFTFKYLKVMTQDDEDCLKFVLKKTYSFSVQVHDEDFFLFNFNPLGPPTNSWNFDGNTEKSFYQELILTKQKRLNLERRPCEENPDYSFTVCVKENLSKQVSLREGIVKLSFSFVGPVV